MKIVFLCLSTFSTTGGIQQFNKSFIKALVDICEVNEYELSVISSHDKSVDSRYVTNDLYEYYKGNKALFAIHAVRECLKADVVIAGHINLAPVLNVIRQLNADTQIVLIAHGIEVWGKLSKAAQKVVGSAHRILAVSQYTRQMLIDQHKVESGKISVFHNTVDSYFEMHASTDDVNELRKKHNLKADRKVIFSLSRLLNAEQYKGYDITLRAIATLVDEQPQLHYIIGGGYDEAEKARVMSLAADLQISDQVTLAGFIEDAQLPRYYGLADAFVMPSKGEGFGIVFIEALACGLPVVAGNQDGSVDAMAHAQNGFLVNPDDVGEVARAISSAVQLPKVARPEVYYHYNRFHERLQQEINSVVQSIPQMRNV